jgi:hypothetical protein
LVGRDAFFVCEEEGMLVVTMVGIYYIRTLDFGLDIVDGVGGFDLEGDGFAREGLDKDLHDGLAGWKSVYGASMLGVVTHLDNAVFLNLQQILDKSWRECRRRGSLWLSLS